MNFNTHLELQGEHSFLSPSSFYWTNYSPKKLEEVYINQLNKERGVRLHDFARRAIEENIKLAPLKKALNMFVNDAIGFRMESEQVLYYSFNCFGTADAISFDDNLLRVHDLKTGRTKPSFRQLDIYCAIFCLEYGEDPYRIQMEQRIYQGNGFMINEPDPNDIKSIMNKAIEFDEIIDNIKS